jgi:hypothetical protein
VADTLSASAVGDRVTLVDGRPTVHSELLQVPGGASPLSLPVPSLHFSRSTGGSDTAASESQSSGASCVCTVLWLFCLPMSVGSSQDHSHLQSPGSPAALIKASQGRQTPRLAPH